MRVTPLLAAALAAALVGCFGPDPDPSPSATPVPPASTPASTPASAVSAPPTAPASVPTFAVPPTPDAATRAGYLAALDALDPEIVGGDPALAVSRGRDQCAALLQFPDDPARLVGMTAERFTSAGHPDGFGLVVGAAILDIVHHWLCPGYPYQAQTPTP